MAEKRSFYNTGDNKGFTKAKFFEAVRDIAAGEDVSAALMEQVGAAAEYELEGMSLRAASKTPGEKKDALQSDYAKALSAAIVPLIGAEPKSAKQLIDEATSKGKVSPKGTAFAAPWVSRVLNNTAGVTSVKVIVDTTDAKGLKIQKEVTAYKKA